MTDEASRAITVTAGTRRRSRGDGSIVQRKDGRWEARLDLGWKDGKRIRKSVYGATQRDVRAKLKQEAAKLGSGVNITAPRETVGTFLTRWLDDVRASDRAPKTIDQYDRLTTKHLIADLGHIRLDKLTTSDVQRWLRVKQVGDDTKGRKPLAAKTCNHLRGVLRGALNVAVTDGLIVRNPVTVTKTVKGESRAIEPLTIEEVGQLLASEERAIVTARERGIMAVARAGSDLVLYRLLTNLGLRIGEALGLQWKHVDLDGTLSWASGRPSLRIESTLQRVTTMEGTSALLLKTPKTAKSRRTLTIPAKLIPVLKAHRTMQKQRQFANGPVWQDTDHVFTTDVGTPIDPRNALREFVAACVRAGIPPRRLHDLRHTAATQLLGAGVSMQAVSDILGHAQFSTTMDVYRHRQPKEEADGFDRLDARMGW